MNILFLTLLDFDSIDERNIYTDLLREFYKNGHSVYAISPVERRKNRKTTLLKSDKVTILKLKIGNTQKTNVIEKGISTVSIEWQFISGIKKYFSDVTFDLVMYSTPPITFCNAIEYVKKRDNAKTYLLLKDIFPQNAVDIGMMTKSGWKGIIYKVFRKKEKQLYRISDYIGCMSQANVNYVLKNNPEINPGRVEVCPNSIEPLPPNVLSQEEKNAVKRKYGIPEDKIIFLYGGNLGRPQGLSFLLQVIKDCEEQDCFFLIVGDGTEYQRIAESVSSMDENKVKLIKYLPKEEYEQLVNISDVGLIFLNPSFTVPNIPSRILSYMQASLPMLAATDKSTDIRRLFEEANMGYWCLNGDTNAFLKGVKLFKNNALRSEYGKNSRDYLERHYTSKLCCEIIMNHLSNCEQTMELDASGERDEKI